MSAITSTINPAVNSEQNTQRPNSAQPNQRFGLEEESRNFRDLLSPSSEKNKKNRKESDSIHKKTSRNANSKPAARQDKLSADKVGDTSFENNKQMSQTSNSRVESSIEKSASYTASTNTTHKAESKNNSTETTSKTQSATDASMATAKETASQAKSSTDANIVTDKETTSKTKSATDANIVTDKETTSKTKSATDANIT